MVFFGPNGSPAEFSDYSNDLFPIGLSAGSPPSPATLPKVSSDGRDRRKKRSGYALNH